MQDKDIIHALQELNCEWERDEYVPKCYNYVYQAEEFTVHVGTTSCIISKQICTRPAEELPLISMVSNSVMCSFFALQIIRSYNEFAHEYTISLILELAPTGTCPLATQMAETMSHMFGLSREFRRLYEEYKEEYGTQCPEQNYVEQKRRDAMEEEHSLEDFHELTRPVARYHYRMSDVLAFNPVMKDVLPLLSSSWRVEDVSCMKIMCDDYTFEEDPEAIATQPLLSPMVGPDNKIRNFDRYDCTYVLYNRQYRSIVIHIQSHGENDRFHVFRLNVLADELSSSSSTRQPPKYYVVALEKIPPHQRKARYRYMSADARDSGGHTTELTPEQQAMELSTDERVRQLLYAGTQAFHHELYLQALSFLLPAYEMQPDFNGMNHARQQRYADIIYMLGYSLNALHQYDRAIYYLEKCCSNMHYMSVCREYIYTLTHLHDSFLIPYLQGLHQQLLSKILYYEDDIEIPYEYNYHYHYVVMQLIDAYVREHRYEETISLIQSEIDEGRSEHYMQEVLQWVQNLQQRDNVV